MGEGGSNHHGGGVTFACPTQGLLRLDWIERSVEEILIKTTTNLILGSFYLASAIYRMYLLMTIFLIFAVFLGFLSSLSPL